MPCFGSHFENGRHLENFENAEFLLSVFSLQILIGGDFRIIDGEKIQPRVRRQCEALVGGGGGSTQANF